MKRGTMWPIGITVVLATTVAANIWVARIASADPSFAIEPDYYKKAITWDSTLAQGRQNTALGWRLTAQVDRVVAGTTTRLSARLVDATGALIDGATVRVSAFPVARAGEVQHATLGLTRAGVYDVPLAIERRGQWEMRFDVRVGPARFTDVARVDVR